PYKTASTYLLSFSLSIIISNSLSSLYFFFFNDPSTPEIYTLSLHDALPIFTGHVTKLASFGAFVGLQHDIDGLVHISQVSEERVDRKSTRLNSSHDQISYAVFCLKKKKKNKKQITKDVI